ncbi:MAG: hypothetical protein AB1916_01275 [Thermodesulfobacteriota bacterium]
MIAFPAQNTLWFWYEQATRRALHGVLQDAARKLDAFVRRDFPLDGFEIFIMPKRLPEAPETAADPLFLARYTGLAHRTVHIGDSRPDFLATPEAPAQVARLARLLDLLGSATLIVHAHHFQKHRAQTAQTLLKGLPGVRILVENNGFDSPWGSEPETLRELLAEYGELGFCLDIAHVKDFAHLSLAAFLDDPLLMARLGEVHFSYSTKLLDSDPYVARGYPGYGPFHAMFSVLDLAPNPRTVQAIGRVPIVVEGIVPREDQNLDFVRQEITLATGASLWRTTEVDA